MEQKFNKNQLKVVQRQMKKFLISIGSGFILYYIISIYQMIIAFFPNTENNLLAEIGVTGSTTFAIIVEVIIYFFPNFQKFRGAIFNFALMFVIADIAVAYYASGNAISANSLPLLGFLYCTSFSYTRYWITAVISISLGVIFYLIMTIILKTLSLIQILSNVFSCIYIIFSCIVTFYDQEIEHRKNFYYLYMSKKRGESLNLLFNALPVPILVFSRSKIKQYNDPFKNFFLGSSINNKESFDIDNQGFEDEVFNSLRRLKDKFSGKSLTEIIKNEYDPDQLSNKLFIFKEKDCESVIQIKAINLIQENENLSVFIFQNLSEIRNIEKKLEKKYQRMLIASFSHDMRTPINGCIGLISDLIEWDLNPKVIEILKIVYSSINKLLYYIDILQDYTNLESNQFSYSNDSFLLIEPLKELDQLFFPDIKEKKLELIIQNQQCNCRISSDFKRIKQIIFVLISNSIKYTFQGEISILINHSHLDDTFYLTVRDTGIGIDEEKINTIFDLFSQKNDIKTEINPQGIGLGLYTSNQIALKLNGKMKLISNKNKGSEFTLEIKNLECDEHSPPNTHKEFIEEKIESFKKENNSTSALKNEPKCKCQCSKFLVVDDDLTNIRVLRRFIKSINESSEEALNGQQAIRAVEMKSQSLCCNSFKIIFMDINMPIMDGVEATKFLKSQMGKNIYPFSYILAVTAAQMNDTSSHNAYTQIGFDGFYQKPLTKHVFMDIISNYYK